MQGVNERVQTYVLDMINLLKRIVKQSKAYHQGYINERFRHLRAFATQWALYEWVRILFGLPNAPPAFQRYMNRVLGDYKGMISEPYLYYIPCYSPTFEEHVETVVRAFLLFRKLIFFTKIWPIFRIFLEISKKRGGRFIRHTRVVIKQGKN